MEMVSPAGFEPTTPRLGIWCSIQLSYGDGSGSNLLDVYITPATAGETARVA